MFFSFKESHLDAYFQPVYDIGKFLEMKSIHLKKKKIKLIAST